MIIVKTTVKTEILEGEGRELKKNQINMLTNYAMTNVLVPYTFLVNTFLVLTMTP